MPKNTVVSFRLNNEQFNALKALLNKDMPMGVNSENQQARKIVVDFLNRRLKYKNEKDRIRGLEQYPYLRS
jgi:hypothetical protein